MVVVIRVRTVDGVTIFTHHHNFTLRIGFKLTSLCFNMDELTMYVLFVDDIVPIGDTGEGVIFKVERWMICSNLKNLKLAEEN